MPLSTVERRLSWNVEFFNLSQRFGGVYQRADLLSVADIAHELKLCFLVDDPASSTPALLLKTRPPSAQKLIVLDQENHSPFPTPPTRDRHNDPTPGPSTDIHSYEYVLHLDCARPGEPHKVDGMQHLPVSICSTANSIQIPVFTDSIIW